MGGMLTQRGGRLQSMSSVRWVKCEVLSWGSVPRLHVRAAIWHVANPFTRVNLSLGIYPQLDDKTTLQLS